MAVNGHNGERINGVEVHKVRSVLDKLFSAKELAREIDKLILNVNRLDTPAFARYAGMVLRDAGGSQLKATPASARLALRQPGNGKMARIVCPRGIEERISVIPDLENAINRLVGIAAAVEDGITSQTHRALCDSDRGRRAFNLIGTRGLETKPDHRYAHVLLPRIRTLGHADIAYFNEVDWRCIDNIASNAQSVFRSCLFSNDRQTVLGARAKTGGDWDMRTRLAWNLENLELPFRFTYRFDCDATSNTAYVRYSAPGISSFPTFVVNTATGKLESIGNRARPAARVYAMRLGAVMAAACFGAGKRIEHAVVIAEGADIDSFMCAFTRDDFVRKTLTSISEGILARPDMRFAPELIADSLHAGLLERFSDASTAVPGAGECQPAPNRLVEPWTDERVLSSEMQRLFHAQRICDIDACHYHGGNEVLIDEAKSDSKESIMSAIAYLEGIAAQASRALTPPADNADARPLFCDHAASRLAIALLEDEASVGSQAESFLRTGKADPSTARESLQFFRAPDALFHAHVGLSDLYQRIGDLQGSEAQADHCIALGPTCAISYLRKADALAGQRRFAEAANVIIAGLHYAIDEGDCAVLYHELALLLWHMRKKRESAACNVYAASLMGAYAKKAADVVKTLRENAAVADLVPANANAAALVIAELGIPVMPGKTARELIARAAVGLADTCAPLAAAPYAEMLSRYFRNDPVTFATCQSLQFGIGPIEHSA